ncbi:MAG: hypothetical protein NTY48_01340, partial [Candidatus Diapherotrites archaeon]|nr:hypothetical protein [Candidatus Diapherotrites archaeon]
MNIIGKIPSKLEELGLRKQEATLYIALLKLGESKTGELCKETGIASSNIYHALESLISRGLAGYKTKNNFKVFFASPPQALNEILKEKQLVLDEKKRTITSTIKELEKIKQSDKQSHAFKYYEGLSGVKAMWFDIENTMTKEDIVRIHSTRKKGFELLMKFYDAHHDYRKKHQLRERLILSDEDHPIGNKRKNEVTEARYLDLKNDAEWG